MAALHRAEVEGTSRAVIQPIYSFAKPCTLPLGSMHLEEGASFPDLHKGAVLTRYGLWLESARLSASPILKELISR